MSAPRAAELQGGSNGADEPLVLQARRRQARRRWWWGIRRWYESPNPQDIDTTMDPDEVAAMRVVRTGAWCYICDLPIATWSSRWPVPEHAKLAISAHRTMHIQGRLDTPPSQETRQ